MHGRGIIPIGALLAASALTGALGLVFSAFHLMQTPTSVALNTSSQVAAAGDTQQQSASPLIQKACTAAINALKEQFRTRTVYNKDEVNSTKEANRQGTLSSSNSGGNVSEVSDSNNCVAAVLDPNKTLQTKRLTSLSGNNSVDVVDTDYDGNYLCVGKVEDLTFNRLASNNTIKWQMVYHPRVEGIGVAPGKCKVNKLQDCVPNRVGYLTNTTCTTIPVNNDQFSQSDFSNFSRGFQSQGDVKKALDAQENVSPIEGTYTDTPTPNPSCPDGFTLDPVDGCVDNKKTGAFDNTCLPGQTYVLGDGCVSSKLVGTFDNTGKTPTPQPDPRKQTGCIGGQCGPASPGPTNPVPTTQVPTSIFGGGGGFGSMGGLSQLLSGFAKGFSQGSRSGNGNGNGNGNGYDSCNQSDAYGVTGSGSYYYCNGNTLYYRSPQNSCRSQQVQQCQYGCNTSSVQCNQSATGQYGYGTDGQPCSQPPTKPDASTCNVGTWKAASATNNSCTTGWQCVPNSSTTTNPTANPTATLSCTPQVADVGQPVTFTYNCTNAASSSAAGFDTGGSLSGTATSSVVAPPTGAGSTATYVFSCNNNSLHGSAQCSVQVNQPAILFIANPASVAKGGVTTLGWTTVGMNSCVLSSPDLPAFTSQNSQYTNVNGAMQTPPLTGATTNFVLTCTTFGGQTKTSTLVVPAN